MLLEESTHAFVLKLWVDDTNDLASKHKWQGYITHVTSQNKIYVKNFKEIEDFIRPFLKDNLSQDSTIE